MEVLLYVIVAFLGAFLFIKFASYMLNNFEKNESKSQIELRMKISETNDIMKRLAENKLTDKKVKLKITIKNGTSVHKEFEDTIISYEVGNYGQRKYEVSSANDNADAFIKQITDDDGSIEKGDTIYPSHMIESIQRME